jgi:hypothetical protein
MTYSMTAHKRQVRTVRFLSVLHDWIGRRATETAIERLDNRQRRDIGWPTRVERPESRLEAATRIAMLAWV